VCVAGIGVAGCSTTNDRGVNINRSTDLFGVAPVTLVTPANAEAVSGDNKPAPAAKS